MKTLLTCPFLLHPITQFLCIIPEIFFAYVNIDTHSCICVYQYTCTHMCASVLSCVWLFVIPWTTRLLCPWNSPGKNTGVVCHSLLQGFFPAQGSNPGFLHFGQILYHLSHQISYIIYVLYYDVISSLLLLGEPTVPKSVSYRVGS